MLASSPVISPLGVLVGEEEKRFRIMDLLLAGAYSGGGLLVSDYNGNAVHPLSNIRLIKGGTWLSSVEDGAPLGADLVDDLTASAWSIVGGTNTIEQDGAETKITCVDYAIGAGFFTRASSGLSTNTVVGKRYRWTAMARVNAGSSVAIGANTLGITSQVVTSTTPVLVTIDFIGNGLTNQTIQAASMTAGEIVWFSGWTCREVLQQFITPVAADGGYLSAPAITNKVTCRKVNPTDITNLTKVGDPAATLTVVSDSAAIATKKLNKICTSGDVYKLDNSAGTATAVVNAGGQTGNTNPHTAGAYVRGSGQVSIGVNVESSAYRNLNSEYTWETYSMTPGATTRVFTIVAAPGAVVYFILPTLIESSYDRPAPYLDQYGQDVTTSVPATATSLSFPTAGLLQPQNGGIMFEVIPYGIATTSIFLIGYTGASKGFTIYRNGSSSDLRVVKVGTVNTTHNLVGALATGQKTSVQFAWTEDGWQTAFKLGAGAWSAWTVTPTDTEDLFLADDIYVGSNQGSTSNHSPNYTVPMIKFFLGSSAASLIARMEASR